MFATKTVCLMQMLPTSCTDLSFVILIFERTVSKAFVWGKKANKPGFAPPFPPSTVSNARAGSSTLQPMERHHFAAGVK